MTINEITNLFKIDYGAPYPVTLSTDNGLVLCFYEEVDDEGAESSIDSQSVIKITFQDNLFYSSGIPGSELLYSHKYGKAGMTSGGFYEVFDSDLLHGFKELSKTHMHYSEDKWNENKHFVLTFHDSLFECIAKSFSWDRYHSTIATISNKMLNELIAG